MVFPHPHFPSNRSRRSPDATARGPSGAALTSGAAERSFAKSVFQRPIDRAAPTPAGADMVPRSQSTMNDTKAENETPVEYVVDDEVSIRFTLQSLARSVRQRVETFD